MVLVEAPGSHRRGGNESYELNINARVHGFAWVPRERIARAFVTSGGLANLVTDSWMSMAGRARLVWPRQE
eukprot:349122-Pyramimonas_sp.AAC.1